MTKPDQNIAPRSLDQLQRWMQSVITHPAGIEAGVMSDSSRGVIDLGARPLDEVVLPSQRLSSADRLRVYGNAYFARLLECLRAEFPAMVRALGEAAFDGLAFGYLLEHPSQSDTLTRLAATLPEYLEQTRPPREALQTGADSIEENSPDFADFLIDLARLERTYNEVFDGAGPEAVSAQAGGQAGGWPYAGLTPELFVQSRIVLHECVRLVALRFPVHEYITAVRRNIEASFPEARTTLLVVTRRDFIVRRIEVTPIQFALLTALQQGDSIGNALLAAHAAQLSGSADLTQLANDVHHWFFEWTAAPLFQRIEEPTA